MLDRFSTFTVLVDKFKRDIRKIKTAEMAEFELKSLHVSCLYYLYRYESLTSKELSEICGEDKAAVSRALEYLVTKNYIYCGKEMQKRYKSPFLLTDEGKAVALIIDDKIDTILSKASEGLSEEDRNTMYRGMMLIAENLDRICDNYEE